MTNTLGRFTNWAVTPIATLLARGGAPHQRLQSTLQDETASLWSRSTVYYCVSFASNVLFLVCSLAGYIISNGRDSDHEPTNRSRFTIASVYALPTVVCTGILFLSTWSKVGRFLNHIPKSAQVHTKLAIFCAVNSALSYIFMDIYALGLDDPDTRFGTSDDIRNILLCLIMSSSVVSFLSLSASVLIPLLAASRNRKLDTLPTTTQTEYTTESFQKT